MQAQVFIQRGYLLRNLFCFDRLTTVILISRMIEQVSMRPERRLALLMLDNDLGDGLSGALASLRVLVLLAVEAGCVLGLAGVEASCFRPRPRPLLLPSP